MEQENNKNNESEIIKQTSDEVKQVGEKTETVVPSMSENKKVPKKEKITQLSNTNNLAVLFEVLLKSPISLIEHIKKKPNLIGINCALFGIASGSFILFGIVMGSFSMGVQLWASPAKILMGVLLSALICFPSLYIFTALTGTLCSVRVMFTGMLATLALMGILLIGLSPVIWVFSQSINSIAFMGFLILACWLLTMIFGVTFLVKLVKKCGSKNYFLVSLWTVIFLLVTLQMSTTFRPIIGTSDKFFTHEKKFFLLHWVEFSSDDIVEEAENERIKEL